MLISAPSDFGLVHLLSARCAGWTANASLELVFQRDDFRSDATTGSLGLLKSLVGGESGQHVRMSAHETRIPRLWCEEEYGRQSEVAKILGVRPSTVSDWFAERKQLTGEQALAIQDLLRTVQGEE